MSNVTIYDNQAASYNLMTGVTVADNSGVTPTVTTSGSLSSTPGTYTITYTVRDAAGNVTTQSRTITVQRSAPTVVSTSYNWTDTGGSTSCVWVCKKTTRYSDGSSSTTTASDSSCGSQPNCSKSSSCRFYMNNMYCRLSNSCTCTPEYVCGTSPNTYIKCKSSRGFSLTDEDVLSAGQDAPAWCQAHYPVPSTALESELQDCS